MTKVVDLGEEREKRKEPCVYCGKDAHVVPLACPRIQSVYVSSEGYVEGIEFRDDWEP
jgi:hypothetical protein